MCLKIVVGAIKYPKTPKKDYYDRKISEGKQFDVKSKSAKDFYEGIKRIVEACEEKKKKAAAEAERRKKEEGRKKGGEGAEGGEQKEICCCIKELVIDGHSTAALGGREGLDKLTEKQRKQLVAWLCKDATITYLGCFAFHLKLFKEYRLHLDLALLLTKKGGSYRGFKGGTRGLYPNVYTDTERKPTTARIPKGSSKAEVKKIFKKIYPLGQ